MPIPPIRRGTLYLVPTPLDFGCPSHTQLQTSLPEGTIAVAARLSHWICENAKSTRAFLKRVDALVPLAQPLQSQALLELPREIHKKGDHSGGFDARPMLVAALQGHDIGLVSEAGMPAIADPGSSVVRAAHELQLPVVPLVGPVSLLLALAASGLNGQNFDFVGYLPQNGTERAQRIRELEALALRSGQAQLFIETPYRNPAILQALLQSLQPQTRLSISTGLTLPNGLTRSASVGQWRKIIREQSPWLPDNQQPAVYALGR